MNIYYSFKKVPPLNPLARKRKEQRVLLLNIVIHKSALGLKLLASKGS